MTMTPDDLQEAIELCDEVIDILEDVIGELEK